jgi:PAS domain S-box-containing protein
MKPIEEPEQRRADGSLSQAEQSLLESEARFRGTFENAAVGIAHVSLDGRWLRVNDKLCNIVGYTHDELLTRTFQDITHPEDLEADLAFVKQVLSGTIQTYSMEKRYIRGDGELLWINLTVSLMRTSSGSPDYFISIIEDISARKSVASALHESESRFRTLADNISQLAWMADDTGARFWFNRRWLDYTGKTQDDARDWQWTSVHRAGERDRYASEYSARCAAGQPWTETCELLSSRGEARWFLSQVVPLHNDAGRVMRWLGTHTDVTAEREAQRKTERARFFELSLDMVCIANRAGELVHLSPSFSGTLGFPLHELQGRSLLELAHADDREAFRAALDQTDRSVATAELTIRFCRKDGCFRWLQWRWAASPDGMSYAIARDVTADRELLESLQRAERELRDKQASLTEGLREREVLLQEIHHRVKNNLQVISSMLNMQMRQVNEPQTRNALEECKTRVEAIALIHEQLYQSKDYRQIPFTKYVGVLIQSIASMSGVVGRRVVLDAGMDLIELPVDKAIPCGLIINELVTNALKHAYPEGRSGEVRVSLRRKDGQLELSVADDGVGMSTSNGSGDSLGMQLVETLVSQIRGKLTSVQTNGMTFSVTCPLPPKQ